MHVLLRHALPLDKLRPFPRRPPRRFGGATSRDTGTCTSLTAWTLVFVSHKFQSKPLHLLARREDCELPVERQRSRLTGSSQVYNR